VIGRALIVTLLRHGEIEAPAHAFVGTLDPLLTSTGLQQMRAALATMACARFAAIGSSPRARCHAFAARIAAEQATALDVLPELVEMHFGAWEGLTAAQAIERDPARFAAFRTDPVHAAPPDGEPYDAFQRRVCTAFATWIRGRTGQALLVTHAGVMRALLAHWLAIPPGNIFRIALPLAATCQVSLAPGEPPCLLTLNAGTAL
jgi:alpha-ribazole phosphatase